MEFNYYMDVNGKDLFKMFEMDLFPAQFSILFCLGNVEKYLRRAGKKTKDPSKDLKKAKDYLDEVWKLRELREAGLIHDGDLSEMLSASNKKQKYNRALQRIENVRNMVETGCERSGKWGGWSYYGNGSHKWTDRRRKSELAKR